MIEWLTPSREPTPVSTASRPVVVFSGVVPLDGDDVLALAARAPELATALAACDVIVRAEAGWSPCEHLATGGSAISDLPWCFPLTVIVQAACFAVLRARGLTPGAVLGISAGEVAAAYASGTIDLRTALRIALHGSDAIQPHADRVRMMMVASEAAHCEAWLAGHSDLEIAAVMAPDLTTVVGAPAAIDALHTELARRGVRATALPYGWGVHSRTLERGRARFLATLGHLASRRRATALALCSIGGIVEHHALDARLWFDMMSHPVQFLPVIRTLLARGATCFVEASPWHTMPSLLPRLGAHALPFAEAAARDWTAR